MSPRRFVRREKEEGTWRRRSQVTSTCRFPTTITVFQDKSFTFVTKTAPASYYLKKAAKVQKGSGEAGKAAPIASVSKAQCREIAEAKMADLSANDLDAAQKIIEGSALSMGFEVSE